MLMETRKPVRSPGAVWNGPRCEAVVQRSPHAATRACELLPVSATAPRPKLPVSAPTCLQHSWPAASLGNTPAPCDTGPCPAPDHKRQRPTVAPHRQAATAGRICCGLAQKTLGARAPGLARLVNRHPRKLLPRCRCAPLDCGIGLGRARQTRRGKRIPCPLRCRRSDRLLQRSAPLAIVGFLLSRRLQPSRARVHRRRRKRPPQPHHCRRTRMRSVFPHAHCNDKQQRRRPQLLHSFPAGVFQSGGRAQRGRKL